MKRKCHVVYKSQTKRAAAAALFVKLLNTIFTRDLAGNPHLGLGLCKLLYRNR